MDQQISKDSRSVSCPSFIVRPEAAHGHHRAYDMLPPEAPREYYYYPYSASNSSTNSSSSSTAVAGESVSSVATKVNPTVQGQSDWLRRRRRTSQYGRVVLGIVGMIVFLLIITGMVVWIGNAFILPQVKYTTRYSQSTQHSSLAVATTST